MFTQIDVYKIQIQTKGKYINNKMYNNVANIIIIVLVDVRCALLSRLINYYVTPKKGSIQLSA